VVFGARTMIRALGAVVLAALPLAGCGPRVVPPPAPARSELAPTGALRIALLTSDPVIATRSAAGELGGTAFLLGRALAADAGLDLAPREYATVSTLMADARTGAWDITVIGVDPARRGVLDYAPPHLVVDITYLVRPGSPIGSVADADRPGITITSVRDAATTLLLQRTLKQATLTAADGEPAAFALVRGGEADACAQNRPMLLGLAATPPGARVLADRIGTLELALALPDGRPAAAAFVSEWIERAKAAGGVRRVIDEAGVRGVEVAPAAHERRS
jgi:polar amino acid transport system substrate-binding protein